MKKKQDPKIILAKEGCKVVEKTNVENEKLMAQSDVFSKLYVLNKVVQLSSLEELDLFFFH